jgi:glutamyl/glutaminyl-tRNA synthetase
MTTRAGDGRDAAPARPDLALLRRRLPARPLTRFAPSPTGHLHLGHVVNAIYVWGLARASGRRVLLRLEDHDRGRCRPGHGLSILDDLDWLGLEPDPGGTASFRAGRSPYRQSDSVER